MILISYNRNYYSQSIKKPLNLSTKTKTKIPTSKIFSFLQKYQRIFLQNRTILSLLVAPSTSNLLRKSKIPKKKLTASMIIPQVKKVTLQELVFVYQVPKKWQTSPSLTQKHQIQKWTNQITTQITKLPIWASKSWYHKICNHKFTNIKVK